MKPDGIWSLWAFLRLTLIVGTVALSQAAQADVVQVGGGGYLTAPPKPCKPLPQRIYRTDRVKGATLTGQWWSSLVWQPYSQPMFAHPLALRCTEGGLTVSYPGARITANRVGIFGLNPAETDLRIGHSEVAKFPEALCDGFSDWFVTVAFVSGASSLRLSFGHGSPFVYCRVTGGKASLSCRRLGGFCTNLWTPISISSIR